MKFNVDYEIIADVSKQVNKDFIHKDNHVE